MHLIAPLAAGVNGAANGSASLLKRGLTSRATYYAAFDASGPVTPTGDVTLDANGGGIFYVNELVDVVCKDSAGNVVRTFTAGEASPAVEVISQSFTGSDYATGASGASKPTTLQAALDKLKTSFGALDFNVLSGGVSTSMQTAVANSITSLFFNVKAASYGAVGDGSTDDSTAVAAAITAASAAGGGTVYFPKGTYKISGTLTVPVGVSLLGSGAGASTLSQSSGATFISMTGTVGQWTYIRDLNITSIVNSVTICGFNAGWFRLDGCRIVATTSSIAMAGSDAACNLLALGCTLQLATGASAAFCTSATGRMTLIGCVLVFPSGAYTGTAITSSGVSAVGCTWKLGTVTSGTVLLYECASSINNVLLGNVFEDVGGAGVPVVTLHQASSTDGFIESANAIGAGYTYPAVSVAASTTTVEGLSLHTRAVRRTWLATDSSPITLPTSQYGSYEVVRSNNTAQTLNFGNPPGPGHFFTLVFNNNQGAGSGTITIGGTNVRGLANFTVNANKISIYTFKSIYSKTGNAFYWSLTSTDANESP